MQQCLPESEGDVHSSKLLAKSDPNDCITIVHYFTANQSKQEGRETSYLKGLFNLL